MADDLIQRLTEWLRKRGEPDSGIRYEAGSHANTNGIRHSLSHVELHGTDADFIAKHFHGQGARDLAAELTRLTVGEPVATDAMSCDDQYNLARKLAGNVGYVLVPEPSIQDAEDAALPDYYAPSNRLHALGTDLGNVPLIKRQPRPEYAHLWTPLYAAPPRTYEDGGNDAL